ncbi:MAG: M48 family metallopeptidase [Betaproteobacteria bacterium]|nr:M48 family metallopeptidase [Betaproteobacteria bacterium]MDH5220182.1 M48 family metallopeptidase [Betaproteobacteria bacterium]MDH5351888.1 M48 family metallopeptidase [Betaproteobacteria bacterium]
MTHEQFQALVGALEGEARRNPGTYKGRVLLLALLGNAYLGAIVALVGFLLLALLASILWLKALGVKLAVVAGAFLWLIVKALWLRMEPPQGTEVTARVAPELFAMIEELRAELRAPRFHRVLVTDELNAGVVQAPRLGIFGWPRNYLLIGLPLMKSLTMEQFKAVLAHEFGHLARGHGRLSNWLYRQRLRWARLMEVLGAAESRGSFLFTPFLRWYAPYFNAYSFPLARANEYEADATSVRLTSARAAAAALTGVSVVGSYLGERYWPQVHKLADEQPQPAHMPFVGLSARMTQEVDEASSHRWMQQALARVTTVEDTHPALKDRLAAIGQAPRLALPADGEAADRLLGTALPSITEAFDQRWRTSILPAWEERYQRVQEERRRLAELDATLARGTELSLQEAYDRAVLTESVGANADAALEQLRALHARAPGDATACFALGARLLERDDPAGVPLLEHVMRQDEFAIARCSELMRDYHWRGGRKTEADAWHQRLLERAADQRGAEKERSEVNLKDKFERHGLAAEDLARLLAQLRAVPGLRKAYFVRKRVAHLAHRPFHVLGFKASFPLQPGVKKRAAAMMQSIQERVQFPGETLIVNVEGENYRFGRKFAWMRGARIL